MPPNDKIRNYLLANLIYGLVDCFEKSELIWVSIYIYICDMDSGVFNPLHSKGDCKSSSTKIYRNHHGSMGIYTVTENWPVCSPLYHLC